MVTKDHMWMHGYSGMYTMRSPTRNTPVKRMLLIIVHPGSTLPPLTLNCEDAATHQNSCQGQSGAMYHLPFFRFRHGKQWWTRMYANFKRG